MSRSLHRLGRARIEALIPHQGAMCLWDEVLDWDRDAIRLRSRGHRDPAHPLRAGGLLRAVHLCEYGAQAMAVHGGLLAQTRDGSAAAAGLLVALRAVELHVTRLDQLPEAIECHARRLADGPAGQQYQFRILHQRTLLASGGATVMLQPPVAQA